MVSGAANDPTRAGVAAPPGGGEALLSLAEIEALAVKAARGAGASWGMAEEAGFAARWLATHELPGPALLLRHLEAFDRRPWRAVAPVVGHRVWRTDEGGPLSPIAAGVALADRAGLEDGPGAAPIALLDVADPGLLLPFVASAAEARGASLRIAWAGFAAVVGPLGLAVEGSVMADLAARLVVEPAAAAGALRGSEAAPRMVPVAVWQGLDRLAFRTFVPASETSRAGAGAGASDNE